MVKQIVVIKPNLLNSKDKQKLSKAGYIVVESESEVKILTNNESKENGLMLNAAMRAMLGNNFEVKDKFVKYLAENFNPKP